MIDKILESNFEKLDLLYDGIMEAKGLRSEAPDVLKQYESNKSIPTYLYSMLEQLLQNPKTGAYLSPISWQRKQSIFFLAKHEKIKNAILEQNPEMSNTEADVKASRLTRLEINKEIEEKRKELKEKFPHLSDDAIQTKINRTMGEETNVPSWETMSIDSQRSNKQEIFIPAPKPKKDSLEETIKSSWEDEISYLETMRSLVRMPKTEAVWHDANINRMVIFGDGTSIPPRLRRKLDKYKALAQSTSNEIGVYAASEDPAERAKVASLEGNLRYYRSQISNVSIGAWRPEDLNELIYGSVTPPDPKTLTSEEVKHQKIGLIPNLCYIIGARNGTQINAVKNALGVDVGAGQRELNNSYIDSLIRNASKKHDEIESKREIEQLEEMRQKWLDSNGDFRSIPLELYEIVVKYIIDRIPGIRESYKNATKQRPERTEDIDKILVSIMGIADSENPEVIIANTKYTKRKSGWDDGRDIKDPADKSRDLHNLAALKDVNLETRHNMGSVIKRVDISRSLAGIIDKSIYQWVLNKVGSNIMPDKIGSLNIGSDPSVVNHFIGSIDQLESKYGFDARMSWFLIPFMETHKANADKYLSGSKTFIDNNKGNFAEKEEIKFSDFHKWTSGVFDNDTKTIIRDKSGNPIVVTGEGFDYYVNLAMAEASIGGNNIDLDKISDLRSEMEEKEKELGEIEKLLKDRESDIKTAQDNKSLAEFKEDYNRLLEKRDEIGREIGEKQKEAHEERSKIYVVAKKLQKLGPKALERFERTIKDEQYGRQERKELSDEAYATIRNLIEVYGEKRSNIDIANLATARLNENKPQEQHEEITSDQVRDVKEGSGVSMRHNNLMNYMMNTLREFSRKNPEQPLEDMIKKNEGAKFYVAAIVESITAMVELSIIQSSQTRIFGGGGLKTHKAYADEHGSLHLPLGWDPDELFDQNSNPYVIMRQKQQIISILQDQIENGIDGRELGDEEINKRKHQIIREEQLINEYRRKMMENPNIRMLADRGNSIAGPSNPFLPKNAEHLDFLMAKMRAFYEGEDVDFSETFTDPETGLEISHLDMIEFMHNHVPMMQSMGINVARVVGRYLVPIRRSIDVEDIIGLPPGNNKDITDLGAMNSSNVITDLLDMIGGSKYLAAIEEAMKTSGISRELEDLSVATKVIPYLALDLSLWANGAKMNGGLESMDGKLTRDFIKNRLFNYMSTLVPFKKENLDSLDQIEAVTNGIVEHMIKLSAPTDHDLETRKQLYRNTMPLFTDMLDGTKKLLGEGGSEILPYNPADIEIIANLIQGINDMREGKNVDDMELRIRNFIDFSNELALDKDSEEIYANTLSDLSKIDKLDNLIYLIGKAQYLENIKNRMGEGEFEDEEELNLINDKIEELLNNLRNYSIIFNTEDKKSILDSIMSYRNSIRNNIKARIERYKDVPDGANENKVVDFYTKLNTFDNIINSSGIYHQARLNAEISIGKDKEKYAIERDGAYKDITISMKNLNLAAAKIDGPVHTLAADNLDELSDKYRERQKQYDIMIKARNKILEGGTKKQIKDRFISIYRTLVEMTKHYNKAPEEIASELLDRAEKYKAAISMRKEKTRRAESAFGGIEIPVLVSIPGTPNDIEAAIFPLKHVYNKILSMLENFVEVNATLSSPNKLLRNEKTSIKITYSGSGEQEITQKIKENTEKINALNDIIDIPTGAAGTVARDLALKKHKYLRSTPIKQLMRSEEGMEKLRTYLDELKTQTSYLMSKDNNELYKIDETMAIVFNDAINFEENEEIYNYFNTNTEIPIVISLK